MNSKTYNLISNYLHEQDTPFSVQDFQNFVKDNGGQKVALSELSQVLYSSELVFHLADDEFITRCGVFIGRWFSFRPSEEEIKKGHILIGHRAIPFISPEITPDNVQIYADGKIIKSEPCSFSMNLAMDTYALFGEGYVIPVLFSDKNNSTLSLKNSQYGLPPNITLTSWPLKEISGGKKFEYGDRILCRIIDWESSLIEFKVLKNPIKKMVVSDEAFQREQWYSDLENAFIDSFKRHGPLSSIDEQLAVLYLENQEKLCIKNCGSIEECLFHTSKIGFQPFGAESRIWWKGQIVPYAGDWISEGNFLDCIIDDVCTGFSPAVMDAIIYNSLYLESKGKNQIEVEDMVKDYLPLPMYTDIVQSKFILDDIKKRKEVLAKMYNRFTDYPIAELRQRVLRFYSELLELFLELGTSNIDPREFPQQELALLSQLYGHVSKMAEELGNPFMFEKFPMSDVTVSLAGMEDTFEEVGRILYDSLRQLRFKGFCVINGNEDKKEKK